MFGLFGSSTPQYEDAPASASQSRGGVLGFFGRLFGGGGAPAYGGSMQPHVRGGSVSFFTSSPQYGLPTPVAVSSPDAPGSPPEVVDVSNDNEEAPPVKAVTIIVKPGPGTTVEEVMEYFRDRSPAPRA